MTDNEIIKNLEHRVDNFSKSVLDLINRQKEQIKQKDTEIDILIRKKETLRDELEMWKSSAELWEGDARELLGEIRTAKTEARKEFVERLNTKKFTHKNLGELVSVEDIDETLTELTERKEDEGK